MEKPVQYKIKQILQTEHKLIPKEPAFSILGDDCEVYLEMLVQVLLRENVLKIIPSVKYIDKRDRTELFYLQTEVIFDILDLENTFKLADSGRINIPDNFLMDAFRLSIGVVRGMIAVLNLNNYLSHIILPIFNVLHLLNGLKAQTNDQIVNEAEIVNG